MAAKKKTTKKKTAAKTQQQQPRKQKQQREKRPIRREIWSIVCLLFAVLSILGCFGVSSLLTDAVNNLSKGLLGGGYVILPFSLLLCFMILAFHDGRPVRLRVTCSLLLTVSIGAVIHTIVSTTQPVGNIFDLIKNLYLGGIAGPAEGVFSGLIGMLLTATISKIGTMIVLVVAILLQLITCANMTIPGIIKAIRQRPRLEYAAPQKVHEDPAKVLVDKMARRHNQKIAKKRQRMAECDVPIDDEPVKREPKEKKPRPVTSPDQFLIDEQETLIEENIFPEISEETAEEVQAVLDEQPVKLKREEVQQETELVAQEIEMNTAEEQPKYVYPPLDLLRGGNGGQVDGTEEMRINSARLNDTLASFGIDAHIVNVVRGPSVTRYELELDSGVRLSKITGLADDIALSLGATGVRISAIPDKISVVGIEVPNKAVSVVLAKEVIASESFEKSKSSLSFAVGRDIGGNSVVGDISKLPHMLIAGTTGSGKSVCMNTLIVSLLYKSSPEDVRMIMIDPKMVELGVYNGIPHLLIPVVTDPKKAAGSLQWAVCEMMRRYRMMADSGVRDVASFNKVAAVNDALEHMPQIVVVIDELADLMLVAAKEVEESICRIAQMGRAAGIHLVIATQRPSSDVITGLMKANIPSRIAFAVASAMESRIILDAQGAEKLVGKGDMLYSPLGQGKPKRIQGCFISEEEVQRVVDFVAKDATANYDSSVIAQIEENAKQSGKQSGPATASDSHDGDEGCDELLTQAVDVIMETGQASVSMLQRRLKLGYARAARIVDEMEERGIVGPFSGSKPRELLITKEQWEAMKMGGSNPAVEDEI